MRTAKRWTPQEVTLLTERFDLECPTFHTIVGFDERVGRDFGRTRIAVTTKRSDLGLVVKNYPNRNMPARKPQEELPLATDYIRRKAEREAARVEHRCLYREFHDTWLSLITYQNDDTLFYEESKAARKQLALLSLEIQKGRAS
jgi:hypothetical protein